MSTQIKVCLVGAGRVARVHANSLVNHVPAANLVAVVDNNPHTLQETGDQFEIEGRFSSLEEALDRIEFHAAVITTPTFTHKNLAVSAASAGKHILQALAADRLPVA